MSNKIKICLAQLNPIAGDIEGNYIKIVNARKKSKLEKVDIILFPEMFMSGYPIDDLVLRSEFLESIQNYLQKLV